MPFKSKAQRGFLFANNPKVAAEFAKSTPKGAKLPEHVKPAAKKTTRKKK
jgi:hypothetical protein